MHENPSSRNMRNKFSVNYRKSTWFVNLVNHKPLNSYNDLQLVFMNKTFQFQAAKTDF